MLGLEVGKHGEGPLHLFGHRSAEWRRPIARWRENWIDSLLRARGWATR
jgi:hypothetical protein